MLIWICPPSSVHRVQYESVWVSVFNMHAKIACYGHGNWIYSMFVYNQSVSRYKIHNKCRFLDEKSVHTIFGLVNFRVDTPNKTIF